jgi:hypothetical protein
MMKAFPYEEWLDSIDPQVVNPIRHGGMDLRDYFAAKAMQALVTQQDWFNGDWHLEASAAYEIADKMMEARNGNKE